MYKLFRSLSRDSGDSGSALPYVWSTLKASGVSLFPGEMAMWAGPPGAGKSTAAINYALAAKVPTLYVAMDMPSRLMAARVGSILTKTPYRRVSEELSTSEGREKYGQILQGLDHLYVTYPSRPDAEGVARAQMAFQEIHGVPSTLMVIDNLMNMSTAAKDEYTGFRELSQVLHYFATELGIAVLLLHHINLGGIDVTAPVPLNYVKGQVSELPAHIITWAKRESHLLGCAVKNRHGKADPSGKTVFSLDYDEERQIISDPIPQVEAKERGWSIGPTPELPGWFRGEGNG